MEKALHTCTVRIAGRELTLTTENDDAVTRRIAAYVDRKIDETVSRTLPTRELAAIIASMSITEELFAAKDENTRLRNELYRLTKENEKKQD